MALIGTASTFGRFVAMPVSGIVSDKYVTLRIFNRIFCISSYARKAHSGLQSRILSSK